MHGRRRWREPRGRPSTAAVSRVSGDVRLSDAEEQTLAVPELHPAAGLPDLVAAMIGNRAVDGWLTRDPAEDGVWELRLPGAEPRLVSFDRDATDASTRDVALFTWGTAEAPP